MRRRSTGGAVFVPEKVQERRKSHEEDYRKHLKEIKEKDEKSHKSLLNSFLSLFCSGKADVESDEEDRLIIPEPANTSGSGPLY